MNFIEPEFVRFLIVILAIWLIIRSRPRVCQVYLLVASFVFYAFHQWQLVFLLGAYCFVDWRVGLWIADGRYKLAALTVGVGFNLLALAFWKYTPLLLHTLAWVAVRLDLGEIPPPPSDWYLPIGISFFAFTGIAYMVDVYRGQAEAERNPFVFALYVSFFPQLVAGPILRAGEFLPQLQDKSMPRRVAAPMEAACLIARGVFKKMVLADRIALSIDPFFAHVADTTTAGVWSMPYVYLYAFQIYFDFSGYTDIARGLGMLFGFRWPENFNLPYAAASVQEFWQRWHMTLSRFLRDYVYIPLGGSRRGTLLTMAALMLTMLLGGIWHGASWSFMLWGGLHGLFLCLHRLWKNTAARHWIAQASPVIPMVWHFLSVALTFHAVCLAWCFFRLTDLGHSIACVKKLGAFDLEKMFVGGAGDVSLWLLVLAYSTLSYLARRVSWAALIRPSAESPAWPALLRGATWGVAVGLLALACVLSPAGDEVAFIYFRF